MTIKVTTQEELNEAVKDPHAVIKISGFGCFTVSGSATVTAYGSATVTAYGSATVRASESATVTAYGSATVTAYDSATVRAYGSATVRAYGSAIVTASGSATVTAYGSATVTAYGSATVTAYDSATVRASGSATVTASGSATVTAYDSATVRAYDSATVRASGSSTVTATYQVSVSVMSSNANVTGGIRHVYDKPDTVEKWLKNYAVDQSNGIAILYKGVNDTFTSPRGGHYLPGTTPECSDWDGGVNECGGGFHFSPHPSMTLRYAPEAVKFVACPVRISDIAVHPNAEYPDKVKAPRLCAPCYEVDIDGNPIKQEGR